MDRQAEKDKTDRVTGLGRRTREEIAKWNQMTALRFQTGERHQTPPASLRGHQELKINLDIINHSSSYTNNVFIGNTKLTAGATENCHPTSVRHSRP